MIAPQTLSRLPDYHHHHHFHYSKPLCSPILSPSLHCVSESTNYLSYSFLLPLTPNLSISLSEPRPHCHLLSHSDVDTPNSIVCHGNPIYNEYTTGWQPQHHHPHYLYHTLLVTTSPISSLSFHTCFSSPSPFTVYHFLSFHSLHKPSLSISNLFILPYPVVSHFSVLCNPIPGAQQFPWVEEKDELVGMGGKNDDLA